MTIAQHILMQVIHPLEQHLTGAMPALGHGREAHLVGQDGPLSQAGQGGGARPVQEALHQARQGGDVPESGVICPEGVGIQVIDLRHHPWQHYHRVAELCRSTSTLRTTH